tara:strand:- start:3043 stop:16521 length:13479 start_codon:yes stop_codon:yes gene_type:complete
MHIQYKNIDETTQEQLCEFDQAGTGVVCRNETMPNVFAQNMLTDGSLGKIEADFAAILPVKICCDQEVDATCETELAVCHDGVDPHTSSHSLKEDITMLKDLNTGTAPYMDSLNACGENKNDKCVCSSNQEPVQASEDRQVYERGSGVLGCNQADEASQLVTDLALKKLVCTDERGLTLRSGTALVFDVHGATPDLEISTQTNVAFVQFVQRDLGGFPDEECNATKIQSSACKVSKESALADYVFVLTADLYRTFSVQGQDFKTHRSESYDVVMRLRQNSGETFLEEILSDHSVAEKRFFDSTNDGCGVTEPCLGAASGLIVTGETAPYVFLYKTKSIQHATSCDCQTRDTLPVTLLNDAPAALLDAKDLSACLATNTCQEACHAGSCSVMEFDASTPAPLSSVVLTALHDKDKLRVSYSDDGTTYEHYSTVSLPNTRTNQKDGAFVYGALSAENITTCDNIGSGCGYHTYADAQAFAENTLRVDWVASTTSQTCEQACVAAGGSCSENLLAQVDTKDEAIAAIGRSSLSSHDVGTNVVPACVDGKGLISFDSSTTVFTFNNCAQSSEEAGYWRASSLSGSNQPVSNAGRMCHLSDSTQKVCPCKITQAYDDTLVAKRLASSEEIQTLLASQPGSDFAATRNTWAPAHEKDFVCVSLHGCEIDGDTYKPATLATEAYPPNTPAALAHKKYRFVPGDSLSSHAKVFTVELFSDSLCLDAIDLSTGVEMNSLSISGDTSTVTPQSMLVDISTPISISDGASFQIEVTFSDAVVLGCSRVVGLGVQNDVSNVNRHRGGVRVEYWDDVAATYKLYAAAVPFSDETPLAAPGYTGNVQRYPLTGLYNTNSQLLSVDLPKHRFWKLALEENTDAPVFEANLCSTPGCTSDFNKKDAGLCPADPDTCYGTQPEDFSCDSTMQQELQTSAIVDGLNLKFVEASEECTVGSYYDPSTATCTECALGQSTPFAGATRAEQCGCFVGTYGDPFGPMKGLKSLFSQQTVLADEVGKESILMADGGSTSFVDDAERGLALDYSKGNFHIISDPLTALLNQDAWTVTMWLNLDSIGAYTHVFNAWDTSSFSPPFAMEAVVLDSGFIQFRRKRSDGGFATTTQTLALQAGTWYHLAFTSSASGLKIYVNGVEKESASHSSTWLKDSQSSYNYIGLSSYCTSGTGCGSAVGIGLRQGLRFYDRELSSTEIAVFASQTGAQIGMCKACPAGMTTEIVGAESEAACGCLKGSYFQKAFKYESLTAWYKFEKDAQDYGPNGVHLQPRLDATPSFSPDGHIIANDDISYLLPTPQTVIPTGTTTLTVSFWVKNWVDGYIMRWVPSNIYFWESSNDATQFEAAVEASTLKHLLATNTAWSLMVAVFDTTGTTLYKDGVKIANSSTAKIPAEGFEQESGQDVGIFCNPNSASSAHDFQGEFKDLRFYTAAFTAEEVGQLYQDSPRCVSCGTGITTAGFGATSVDECSLCAQGSYLGIKPPEVIEEGFTVVNADKDLAVGYTRHVAAQGKPYSGEFGYDADGIGKNAAFTNIEAVSWIPNTKKVLITETSKNKVKYMDLETYEVTTSATLTSSTHGLVRRACAVDDKKFYLATSKGILEYDVDTDSLSLIYTEGSGINTYGCAISQNGWLAFSQFQTVWELELANPTNVRSLGPGTDADSLGRTGRVYYMTYSPDDEYLVFTDNQWNQVRKVHRTTLVNSAIAGVQYSNSENNADGKAFTSYFLYPKGLAFSRDGKYLYVAAWNSVKKIDYEGNPDSSSYVSTLTGQTSGTARDLSSSYTGSPDQAKFANFKDLAILGDGYAIGVDYGTTSIYQINLGDDFVVPPTLQYFTEQVCLACSTGMTTASAGATSADQCNICQKGYVTDGDYCSACPPMQTTEYAGAQTCGCASGFYQGPANNCTACGEGMTSEFGSTSNLQCFTPRTVCSATQASVHPPVSSSDMGDVADAEAKYVVLTGPDAEYKVLFPDSPPTTVDLLVISGSSYQYATKLSVTGLYTVSAKKAASSFLQIGGVSVSSVGEGSSAITMDVLKGLFPTYTTGLTGFAQGRFIGAVLAFNPEVGADLFEGSSDHLNLGSRTWNIAENGGLTVVWKGRYIAYRAGPINTMFGFGAGGPGGSKSNTLRCGFPYNHDLFQCQLWDSSQVECLVKSNVLGQGVGQTKGKDFSFIVRYDWQTKVLSMNVDASVFTTTCTNSPPEILTTPNTLIGHSQSYGGSGVLYGKVHGLYAYDRLLSDENTQEVLDAIVIGDTDNVQGMVVPQVILRYNTQACAKDARAPSMHTTHTELLSAPNNVSFIRYDLGSVKNIESVNILLRGRGEKHGVQRQVSSWNTLKVKYSAVSDDFDQAYVCATYDPEHDDAVFHSAETNLLKKSCLVKAQYIFVSVDSGVLSYDEVQIVPSKYQFGPAAKYTWSQNAANTNFITLWSNLSGTTSWIEGEGERKDPFFYSLNEHFDYEYFDGQNEFFSWPEGYLIGGLTWKQHLAAGDRKPMFPSTAAALQPLVATFPSKTAYFQIELPFANVISEILVQPGPRYPEWKAVWGYAWPGRVKVFTSFADDFDLGVDSTAMLAHEGDINYGTRDARGIPRDDTFEVVFTNGPKRGRFVRMVFERCTESLCVNNPDEEIQFHEILQFRAGLKPCVHKCEGCCADGALIGADSFPSLNLGSLSQGQTTTANLYLASAQDCQHTTVDNQATMRPCPEGRECKTDAYVLEYLDGKYQLSGTDVKTPTLQVRKGKTSAITFPSGHPLVISENSEWGAAALSQDVVTAGSVATITVPAASTKTVLYYYCSLHENMGVGKIEILESDGERGTSACAIDAEQNFAPKQTEFVIGPIDTSSVFKRNFEATLPWMRVTDSMPDYDVNNGHLLKTDPASNQMSTAYVDETSAMETGVFLAIDTTRPQVKSGLEPLTRGNMHTTDKKVKTISLSTQAGYMGPGGGTGFVQKIRVDNGWDRVSVELEPHLALKSVWKDNLSNMYPTWTDSRNVKVASFITDKELVSGEDWKWIVCGEKSEQIRNFPTPSFVLDQINLVGDSPPDSVVEDSKTTYKTRDIFESQGGFIKNLPSFADINCDPSQVASTDCRSSYSSTMASLGYAKCDLSSDLSGQENCVFTVQDIIEHHFVNAFNRIKQPCGTLLGMGAKSWYASPVLQPDHFTDSTAISLGTTQNFLFDSKGGFTLLLKTKDLGSAEYGTYFKLFVDNSMVIWVAKKTGNYLMVQLQNLATSKVCQFDTDVRTWSIAEQAIVYDDATKTLKSSGELVMLNNVEGVMVETSRSTISYSTTCSADFSLPDVNLNDYSSSDIVHEVGGSGKNLKSDLYGVVLFDEPLTSTQTTPLIAAFDDAAHATYSAGAAPSTSRTTASALAEFQAHIDTQYSCIQYGEEVDKLTLPASSLTRGLFERTPVIASHLDTAPVLLNKGKATVCHTDLLGAQVDTGSGSTARFLPRRDYSIASNPSTGYDQKGSLAYGGFDGMPCSIDTGLVDSAAEEAFLTEKTLQEVLDLFNDKQDCVCGLIFTGFASNGTAVKQTFRVERTDVTEGDGHEHSYVTLLSAADAQAGHVLGRAYVQSDKTIRVYESDPATNVYGATTKALPGEYKICQDESDVDDSDNLGMNKKNPNVLDGRVISLGKTPRPTYQPGVDGLVQGSYQNSVHWPDDACSYMKPHMVVDRLLDDVLDAELPQLLLADASFKHAGVMEDLDNSGFFGWLYPENQIVNGRPTFTEQCQKDPLNNNLPVATPCMWTKTFGGVQDKLICDRSTWSPKHYVCPNKPCGVLTNKHYVSCNDYCASHGLVCSSGWHSGSGSSCESIASWKTCSTIPPSGAVFGCECAGGNKQVASPSDTFAMAILENKFKTFFVDKMYTKEQGWMYFWFAEHVDAPNRFFVLPLTNNVGPQFEIKPGNMLIGGRGGVGMSAERCGVSDDYYNEKGVLSWKPSIDAPGTEFFLYHMFLFGESHACRHHNCQDAKVYEDSAELSKIRNAKIDPDSNPSLLIMQGSRFALSSLPKVPFKMQDNCLQIALAAPSFTDGQIVTKYYITKANALFAQDFGSFDECLGCSGGVCGLGKLPCKYFDTSTQKTYFTANVYTAASESSELFTFWLANVADATSSDGITLEGFAVSAPGVPELSMATASWQTGDKMFTTENKACADGSSRRRALLSSLRQVRRKRPISSRKTIVNLARRMNAFRRLKLKEMRARDTMKLNVESMVLPQRSMRKLLTIGAGGSEMDKTTSNTNMQREVTSLDGNRVMADSVCGSLPGFCELMRVSLDIPDDLYCSPESDIIEHVDNELSSLQAVTVGGFHFKTVSVYRAALLTKCFQSTVYSRRLLGETSHTVATAYVSLHNALSTQSQQECSGDQHCVLSLNLEDTEIGKKGFSAVHIVTDQNGEQGVRVCFGGPECHHRIEISNHTQLSMLPVEVKSDAPSSWAIIAVVLAVVLFIALCFAAKRWYDSIPKYKEVSTVATNDYNEMGQPAYQQPLYPMYPDSYDQPPSTTSYSYLYTG